MGTFSVVFRYNRACLESFLHGSDLIVLSVVFFVRERGLPPFLGFEFPSARFASILICFLVSRATHPRAERTASPPQLFLSLGKVLFSSKNCPRLPITPILYDCLPPLFKTPMLADR